MSTLRTWSWLAFVAFVLASVQYACAGVPFRCNDCERDEHGKIKRSAAAVKAFKRAHPLPAECRLKGEACVVDHIVPISCATSPEMQKMLDNPANMQWQTRAMGHAKDAWEQQLCPLSASERVALGRRYYQIIPRAAAEIGVRR